MPSLHSLALPLPAEYAENTREGFSFFCTNDSSNCDASAAPTPATEKNAVGRYLDDLCAFLRSSKLIQAHPENFFQYILGETWAVSPVHFDNSPVDPQELAHTQMLLKAFTPILQGDDVMDKLRALVRDGPPTGLAQCPDSVVGGEGAASAANASLASLQAFYASTRSLMLSRARRPENDAARLTLLTEAERLLLDCNSASAKAQKQHEHAILDLVVSYGMNPKKQHEVRIMRDTIRDLALCCNVGAENTVPVELQGREAQSLEEEEEAVKHCNGGVARVETAINIGEGKGYVSRALALCDNLQVIGLDCNPAHKERTVERFESLLETSFSSRNGSSRVNLMYAPRGHMASIACRIDEKVDWASLLHGHVRTCADPCFSPARSYDGDTCAATEYVAEDRHVPPKDDMVACTRIRSADAVKLACRVCGKVVRQESTTVIMKHVYGHLQSTANSTPGLSPACAPRKETETSTSPPPSHLAIPTWEEVHQWNLLLSQHAYVARLTEHFFTVTDVGERHSSSRKDAALLKRLRIEDSEKRLALQVRSSEATPGYLTLASKTWSRTLAGTCGPQQPATPWPSLVALEPAYTARGYRVELLLALLKAPKWREPYSRPPVGVNDVVEEVTHAAAVSPSARQSDTERDVAPPGDVQSPERWSYTRAIGTIVGYDGGADSHLVCIDQETKRRALRLYRLPAEASTAPHGCEFHPLGSQGEGIASLGDWQLPDPVTWGRERVALVLSVLPPTLPSTPAVYVPSVRNTIFIGLHTCGDLGSNVCRIFRNSSARGLLLVSCCWHALTPKGFPLSRALQRRGFTTTSVSFLLATQPVDAWSSASPEGHRSSAKLLFFRSLFKLLWTQLAKGWKAGQRDGSLPRSSGCPHTDTEKDVDRCTFPETPPHLEPAFLRRISREKDTLTFAQFVHAVAVEYIYVESAKTTLFTPWNIGQCCAACRETQEAYVRNALGQQRIPETMGARFERDHFASFLGLTVLRMWMCHLVESLLLLDRALYLHEELANSNCRAAGASSAELESSAVALVPLFDGALSPRMYGILARRGGSAYA
ncbi:hypothetical protein JKF63_05517 [Porcisia hertigi]|uniref:Methyltransferase domain-containing protein n=1 Tax=Porcisia hertigi TaxID=2761500 RepID=A0A836IBK0_9TRYP|nr:hypothetical protein JKF63_05517 [Porcisia hertigi]